MRDLPNTNNQNDKLSKPMTTGGWIKAKLLMCIPLVNIVLIFIWAFGSNVNISKRNYYRASLILALLFFIITTGTVIAGFFLFQDQIADFNERLRNAATKLNI